MQKGKLDIFDYFACWMFADIITTGIFAGSFFLLTFGVLGYIMYEKTVLYLEGKQ